MVLEVIDDSNFEEFLASPVAFLLIGKTGCGPCMEWTASLNSALAEDGLPSGIRWGKLIIGDGKLTNLKRVHGTWLSHVREMPYNSIWMNGTMVKEWPGGGELVRLTNRLEGLGLVV